MKTHVENQFCYLIVTYDSLFVTKRKKKTSDFFHPFHIIISFLWMCHKSKHFYVQALLLCILCFAIKLFASCKIVWLWKSNQGIVLSLLHGLTSCTQPCRIVWSLEFILLFLYFRIRYLTYSVEWELRLCLTKINAFLLWIGKFNKLINKCLNWNMIKHSLKKISKLLSIICYMICYLSFVTWRMIYFLI